MERNISREIQRLTERGRNIIKVHDLIDDMNLIGKQDDIESALFQINY